MNILAIESSCDETAVAIVKNGNEIISSEVASQIKTHEVFGGVVPEIASRQHCEIIDNLTKLCIKNSKLKINEIDCIATTFAPGLLGSLLVGVNYAKGLSFSLKKPLVAVHHLRSHIAANYLTHKNLKPPFLALIISGGHSNIVKVNDYCKFEPISKTYDDAVGEAFDKVARTIGLSYPGGAKLEKLAKNGNELSFKFPKPKIKNSELDFSFSGLKTAVINTLHNHKQKNKKINLADLAASFQLTVCKIINEKVEMTIKKLKMKKLVVAGGVCCNEKIRNSLKTLADQNGVEIFMPNKSLCQDNAAMVGAQAFFEFKNGKIASLNLNAVANLPINYI